MSLFIFVMPAFSHLFGLTRLFAQLLLMNLIPRVHAFSPTYQSHFRELLCVYTTLSVFPLDILINV